MGRAKAPVLPDPVSARPMMSLPVPAREREMEDGRKGVGQFNLRKDCGK